MKCGITILCAALVMLSSIGASCVNDGVTVVVDLSPIVARYQIRPGNDTTFSGRIVIKLDSLVSPEFRDQLTQGRIYDLKVKVEGSYSGSVTGYVSVQVANGSTAELLRYPATGSTPWSNFSTPQSLLGHSPYLVAIPHGVDLLLEALSSRPMPQITLTAFGLLSVAPIPDNLYVTVELYLQADARIN